MTSLAQRREIITLIDEAVAAGARQARACETIGLSPRTLQRWQRAPQRGDGRPQRIQTPRNQLSEAERQHILQTINTDEYGHLPPSQIVPRWADEGIYLASESTLYRLLRAVGQLTQRSPERSKKPLVRPQPLLATQPNQLYSWDITYLPGPVRGQYYYLYLFLDLFSRYIVGWQIFETEDSAYASELMRDICRREGILPGQVVLHSDNGGPMKGATMLATLRDLGVMPSFSRPAVSDDNPYSESLFKTLKYRVYYPRKGFPDLQAARAWVQSFALWYNREHRHSGIRFVTPEQRHQGHDKALLEQRHTTYQNAREKHPERWSGKTRNWHRIDEVKLNPGRGNNTQNQTSSGRLG